VCKTVALQALNDSDVESAAANGANLSFEFNESPVDNKRHVTKLQRTTASGVTPASMISSMSDA
jgi:hypothetical protein